MIDLGNKLNVMNLAYTKKLRLYVRKTNIKANKMNKSYLNIFEIIIASFSHQNKLRKAGFFKKPFLVANTRIEVILKIFFFAFGNVNIQFAK